MANMYQGQKARKTNRITLVSGAYQARSLIASAQRCINLYPESNAGDPQAPVPVTHYPTPGTVIFSSDGTNRKTRGTYRTSQGIGYCVIGASVYLVSADGSLNNIGSIADRQSQVYFADNGQVIIIVDGMLGWVIDISDNQLAQIIDPSFYGADFVLYLDTFFIFNRPNTNQFYISLSNVSFAMLTNSGIATGTITNAGTAYSDGVYPDTPLTGGSGTGATANITVAGNSITVVDIVNPGKNYLVGDVLSAVIPNGLNFAYTVDSTTLGFDSLDIAAKSGNADPIVGISTTHRELWLIGELTTEVWIGTGAADFYFQQVQGAFIDHGCAAKYSISAQDVLNFWLMQDKQGNAIIVKGSNYSIGEISTPAIVAAIKTYAVISDAIGYCYQQQDHSFYIITFPTANKTWAYELVTGQWHELAWADGNGNFNRHRGNCCMFVYGKNIIGDWERGILYNLDPHALTDAGSPIVRLRTFPHMIIDGKRVNHNQFIVDLQVGATDLMPPPEDLIFGDFNNDFNNDFNYITQAYVPTEVPLVTLKWSDDRGATYNDGITQSIGLGGEYLKQLSFWRLGQARDRVYEVSWSSPVITALNGAFLQIQEAGT